MLDKQMKEQIRKKPTLLRELEDPSEELMLYAVASAWNNLKYFKQSTPEVRRAALENKGWAIQYISEPSQEEQLIAVRRDADAIQYIKDPDCEVQVEAVKTSWNAVRYIEKPCREARRQAIIKNEQAIAYIGGFEEDELEEYLKLNLNILKYIYDSVEMDDLIRILSEEFQGNPSKSYIKDFMELEILDLDKINFIGSVGSKATRQKLVDYVLGR